MSITAAVRGTQIATMPNPGTIQTPFTTADANSAAAAVLSACGQFDGKAFKVRASGRIVTGASMTVHVALQLGKDKTANTTLANPSATVNGTVPFVIEAMLIADSTSQELTGVYSGVIGGNAIASTAITPVSSFNPNAKDTSGVTNPPAEVGNSFSVAITFGTSNASNSAVLNSITIESL